MNLFDELAQMKQEAWSNDDHELLDSLHSLENIAIQTIEYRKSKRGKMDAKVLREGGFPWHYSFQHRTP